MMKRMIAFFLIALLCLGLWMPALAAEDRPLLVDGAHLLSDREKNTLLATLQSVSQKNRMDIVVVTADSLDGAWPEEYADDFYDYNGYAEDGVLLLVSMEERDWHISTAGYGMTAVTDDGLFYMENEFVDDLSEGAYYDAFVNYAQLCDELIGLARSGTPYKAPFDTVINLLIALVVGFVIALIITGIMRSKLRSVRPQPAAASYVKAGSMKVTQSKDLFLYTHIDRRPKPKDSGGSRTHTASSGRIHGGGGGKF